MANTRIFLFLAAKFVPNESVSSNKFSTRMIWKKKEDVRKSLELKTDAIWPRALSSAPDLLY